MNLDNFNFTGRSSSNSVDDDPVLENLECSSDNQAHCIHDFSIHDHTGGSSSSVSLLAATSSSTSFDQDCIDSFTAVTCCGTKQWTTEDVFQVISAEKLFFESSTITIRFPDRKLNKQLVTRLNKRIRVVNFLQSPYARRCCVTIKDSKCRNDIIKTLNSTRFGSGFLSADSNYEESVPADSDIDPFTLFVDSIPPQMGQKELIKLFPNCQQITVGYTNKIYYTKRYAFIIFLTVKDAIETFEKSNNNPEMLVRFRRFNGSAHLPTESEIKKCQSGIKNLQQGFPIVTDCGPPVLSTERNYKIVHNVTIKTEPSKKTVESALDEDRPVESGDQIYQLLLQSRFQFSKLKQLE